MPDHYVANVGNRDLWLDGAPIPAEQCRQRGQEILADYDAYRDRLSAPILEAGLRYVLDHHTDGPGPLVHLFATNQSETAGPYRDKDTVDVARVLKRLLPERLRGSRVKLRTENVSVVEISENPSLYDGMYEFFGHRLGRGKLKAGPDETWYASPVGGVPGANFALLMRAVERYGGQCHPLYVPEGRARPLPLDLSRQLLRTELRGQARREIVQREFGRAAELLRRLAAPPPIVGLAEHAQHRLHFDFQCARQALEEQTLARPNDERELALRLRDGLDELLDEHPTALIAELFFNLELVFAAGRYVDFLLRVFRFQEAAARLAVEEALGATTESNGGRADPRFVAAVEGDAGLRAHLEAGGVDYRREPNTYVLRKIVEHLAGSRGSEPGRYSGLRDGLGRLESLGQLRNKSIGAHGFQGVSREDIERLYGGDLIADLRALGARAGADLAQNPFEAVAAALLAWLDRD